MHTLRGPNATSLAVRNSAADLRMPEQLADVCHPRSAADSDFLKLLGERVRETRARRGMTRKILARDSGVSERYLAQLETGQGNISILLLRNIADALDIPLEALVLDRPGAAGRPGAHHRVLAASAGRMIWPRRAACWCNISAESISQPARTHRAHRTCAAPENQRWARMLAEQLEVPSSNWIA